MKFVKCAKLGYEIGQMSKIEYQISKMSKTEYEVIFLFMTPPAKL